MKKICIIVCSLILALTALLPLSAAATSNQYDLPELGLELTVPDGYAVITRDTPADDPIFQNLGTTKSAVTDQFESDHIYLNGISEQAREEIVVTMEENIIDNFSLFSDTTLDFMATMITDLYSDYGIAVSDYEIYQHTQAKFIKVYFTDLEKTVFGLQYYTVYDGKALNFTMRSYEGFLLDRQQTALKAMVDSIRFDNDPPMTEPGEDTEPFQYTDADTGVTFTVPANWKQEAFSEDRKMLDAKFVSTKEEGCGIIYGSTDIWAQMPAIDRIGYTRSQIDNSVFTKADVAEIYNTTVDQIGVITYNGVQYYIGDANTTSDINGFEITITVTYLLRVDNGWMYTFEFSGTRDHKLFAQFARLMDSVEYPTVSNAEKTQTTKPATAPSNRPNQNTSKESKDNFRLIAVVVLLVTVPGIVVAIVVIRRKHTSATKIEEPVFRCKNCDRMLPSDSVFCHVCGTKIDREDAL